MNLGIMPCAEKDCEEAGEFKVRHGNPEGVQSTTYLCNAHMVELLNLLENDPEYVYQGEVKDDA